LEGNDHTHTTSDHREWAIVAPWFPEPKTNGRRASIARRELLNAMFYVTKQAVDGIGGEQSGAGCGQSQGVEAAAAGRLKSNM
jgi:hypothetical protein